VDFFLGKPKSSEPSSPSPEQIREEQLRQQRIAEAQRAEQLRIEAENQRRANFKRAADWRARIDRAEEEMTEQLGGAFDVVRKGPSTNSFGTGNGDVSIDGDSGDASVVDFRDRPEDREPSVTPAFFLEEKLRAEETESYRLQQTPYGVTPPLAGDSRDLPFADRVIEAGKDFARDVAEEAKDRVLKSLETPELKAAREVWDKENSIITDWQKTMDPARIADAARNGGSIGDDELRLRTYRMLANDPTRGTVTDQDVLAGDLRSAAVNGSQRYVMQNVDDFLDVRRRLQDEAKNRFLRVAGLGDGN
jgi:hypothetical protein